MLQPRVLGISWGEIALLGALVTLLIVTGRVATFVRGVRRGLRDDDPSIRARIVDREDDGTQGARSDDGPEGKG